MSKPTKSFSEILSVLPAASQDLYRQARALEESRRNGQAAEAYGRLTREHPEVAGFWMYLGQILLRLNRVEESKSAFQMVITIEPDNRFAHSALGHVHNELGRYEDALRHLGHALELNPAHAGTYNNMGRALSQGFRRFEDAKKCFEKAIRLDPGFDVAYNNLAAIHYELGEFDEAMTLYREALRINPEYPLTHNNLGLIYMRQGQLDTAISHFRQAIGIDRAYVTAHYNLGCAYLSLQDREAALHQVHLLVEYDRQCALDLLTTFRQSYPDSEH